MSDHTLSPGHTDCHQHHKMLGKQIHKEQGSGTGVPLHIKLICRQYHESSTHRRALSSAVFNLVSQPSPQILAYLWILSLRTGFSNPGPRYEILCGHIIFQHHVEVAGIYLSIKISTLR
jgi:hypothetical protein